MVCDMSVYRRRAVENESVLVTDNLAAMSDGWAESNGNPYGVLAVHVSDPSVTLAVDAVLTSECCIDWSSDAKCSYGPLLPPVDDFGADLGYTTS